MDFEWSVMGPALPNEARVGSWVDDRRVLIENCWVLRSDAPWRDVPARHEKLAAIRTWLSHNQSTTETKPMVCSPMSR